MPQTKLISSSLDFMVKVDFAPELVIKAQKWSRCIALLLL
jgi:hypothetical protein